MKPKQLNGRVVVITGASSGAGRAAALEFARCGAQLVLAARNRAALEATAEECRRAGAGVTIVPADVTHAGAMIGLANRARRVTGQVDVWVNNAGVLAAGVFEEMPMAVHRQVIETNLLGYMNGAHAILPVFKQQRRGVLINNISVGGFLPVPYGTGYSASKFGLRGFSQALRAELAGWPHIHVCNLYPAFLDTPGMTHAGNHTGRALKPAPPVYDPRRLARAMVRVAARPAAATHVGSASLLLQLGHALFPRLLSGLTGGLIRAYLRQAEPIALTDGNLFSTVDYGMSTYGGYGLPGRPGAHRKYLAGMALAAFAAGWWLAGRSKP